MKEKLNNYIAVDNASPKKNRMIALEDIPKGTTVLTEKPLISKCQKENYKFHKSICQMKKELPDLNVTTLIQLMAQLLYKMKNDSSIENTINKLYCYENKERMENKQILYIYMLPILQLLKMNMDPTRIAHLMNVIDCNQLRIYEPSSQYFAYGMYINASKIGHDCNPNCMLFYQGNELHIRSIRTIKKDENITFSYISCNLPYSERKIRLKNIFNYECQCDRCMEVKDHPELDPMEGIHCHNKKCQNYIHQELLNPCSKCHAKYPVNEKKLIKQMVQGLKHLYTYSDSMKVTDKIIFINELPMTLSQFKKKYLIPQNYFNIFIHNLQNIKLIEYDRVDEEMLGVAKKFNLTNEKKPICIIRPDSDVDEMPGKNSLEKRVNIGKEDVEIFDLFPFNKSYLSLISRMNFITEVFQMSYQETLRMNDKKGKSKDIYSLSKEKTIRDNLSKVKEDLLTLKSNYTSLQDNINEIQNKLKELQQQIERGTSSSLKECQKLTPINETEFNMINKNILDINTTINKINSNANPLIKKINLNNLIKIIENKQDLSVTMLLDEEQKKYIKQTFMKFNLKKNGA
ncbi:hypothetical protein PIROE2DRAFT_2064 [Piromyces sp. E2]|nr:hypothetical protein PIROE2DRAFT_2064 [Piromyces sp. E2]|eukprot:OUM69876.1 hypothetical protein PIROE2DRAFT_2064 [Piromyces sp. E2]